jgi:pilus assembly protein Flp/PilA
MLKKFFKDERGEDMIEYALLAAFISIAAVAMIKLIGPILLTLFTNVKNALS